MNAEEFLNQYDRNPQASGSRAAQFLDQTTSGDQPAPALEQPAPQPTPSVDQPPPLPSSDQPPPLPSDQPPPADTGFNINVVSEGLKKGFADVAAIPGYAVDVMSWSLDQIPGVDMGADPIGGSKMIREGWELLLDYRPQTPTSETEKYAGKVSEFIGGSIVMGGGLVNKMIGANATMSEIRRAAIVEVAQATGGGVAAQWQGDIFADAYGEEYRYLGEITGGLSGATATVMIPDLLKKTGLAIDPLMRVLKVRGVNDVRALVNDYGGALARNRARKKVAAAIGDNPNSSRNIDRTLELGEEIEGFTPGPAQASGAEGIRAMQQSVDSKNVANMNRAIANELTNREAIEAYYRQSFPEMAAADFSAKTIFKRTRNDLRRRYRQIETGEKSLAKAYERKPVEAQGARLQAIAQEKIKAVKKVKDGLYGEMYQSADTLGVVDDVTDIRELVVDIQTSDQGFFDTVPGVYSKIKGLLAKKTKEDPFPTENIASFRKLHSLYREISREYGRALRADDGAKLYHLGGLKNTLDDKLAKYSDPVYGTFAERKNAVDTFYREEYHNVFKQGLGAEILGIGKNKPTPEGLIISQKVLKKGTSQGLDQFNKLFADVPEAQQFLQDGILDVFAAKTVKQGNLSQSAIDTFMRDYTQVLDKLPVTQRAFAKTDALLDTLARRGQKIKSREALFARETTSRYAKLAEFEDLDGAVEYALTDKGSMRILLRAMKTPESKKGLATTFADHVMNQKDPWKFLTENEGTLKPVFNQLKPGHYRNLKNTAEAMNILDRYSPILRLNANQVTTDALQEAIGTTVPSAFAQFRQAALYHTVSQSYVTASIGAKYLFKLQQDNVERLIEEALYEPDLAKLLSDLTQLETIAMPSTWASRLGQWAIERGVRATPRALKAAAIADDQEQQPNTP